MVPYISHGTTRRAHVRARVLLSRQPPDAPARPGAKLLAGLAHYVSVELPGEKVTVEVAEQRLDVTAGPEGYVEATLELPGLAPGWHRVTFGLAHEPGYSVRGRLVVVDPMARLGVVSDVDDTIIHTGLTRLLDAVRTSLFVPEHARREVAGASELYRGLVAGAAGRLQVFYVSTGAWNTHPVLERFLLRHGFPEGPLIMTDWGPSGAWLFREKSVAFKARVIAELIVEHPHLLWVLIGDSGQDDAEAYAAVARAHPERVRAVYIRDVPPESPLRAERVRRLADELSSTGVPMLLVRDSGVAADDAYERGLIDEASRDEVRRAVEDAVAGRIVVGRVAALLVWIRQRLHAGAVLRRLPPPE